jgi:hypothetical protein
MPEHKLTLNPQIRTLEIGVRDLRTITIYPLSFRDQMKLKDLIFGGLTKLSSVFAEAQSAKDDDLSAIELIQEIAVFAIEFIETNIDAFIKLVVLDEQHTEENDVLSDMTVNQVIHLAELVYEVNYDFLSKTIQKLLNKVNKPTPKAPTTPSITSFPSSPEDTPTH